MACNDNWVYRPDFLYVPDHTWLSVNPDAARCAVPERWTPNPQIARDYPGWKLIGIDNTNQLHTEHGLSTTPGFIHHGGFAGFQMLNLAVLMGAKHIILLGYDCQKTNGMLRWKGAHQPGVERGTDGSKFDKWRQRVEAVAPQLEQLGVEVINATRSTSLRCFPMMKTQEAIDHVMEAHLA